MVFRYKIVLSVMVLGLSKVINLLILLSGTILIGLSAVALLLAMGSFGWGYLVLFFLLGFTGTIIYLKAYLRIG